MEGPDTNVPTRVQPDRLTPAPTEAPMPADPWLPSDARMPTGIRSTVSRAPTEPRPRTASIDPPPTIDATVLGARIAALRQRHGWTQRRLAEEAGVSNGYVAQLELGRLPNPGKSRLDAIAHALLLRTSDALLSEAEDEVDGDVSAGAERMGPTSEPAPGGITSPARASGGNVMPDRGSEAPIRNAGAAHDGGPGSTVGDANGAGGGSGGDAYGTLGGNVLGMIEQVRGIAARQLPVFRWGSCGDPRDRLSPPDPDRLEFPPPGRESLIGDGGFGVVVKGESMAGRGIHDGDVVWVNPDRPYALGKVVLALATSDEGGEAGMVVKTYARTEVGECLVSETESGRSPLVCHEFKVIGPVVGITSWRLPS